LKTGYRYRCDVRAHPTDLTLCCSDVTFQLPQNASFNVILQSFCWLSSVLLLLAVMLSNQTSHRPTLAVTWDGRVWGGCSCQMRQFSLYGETRLCIAVDVASFPASSE